MIFGGIQRSSTIDFPGLLSCVLFTKGCDFDCFYCHNRGLIKPDGEAIGEKDVLDFLKRRQGLLEVVVISGGEPTVQSGLPEFLRRLRMMEYRLKLDTNGQRPSMIKGLTEACLLDYAAVDIKALPKDYKEVCGIENGFDKVLTSIDVREESGVEYEVRTTLYPGMTFEMLQALMGRVPYKPRWRLNYFKMPVSYKPEDEKRLSCSVALTKKDIECNMDLLRKLQPRIISA